MGRDQAAAIRRWKRGHELAAERSRAAAAHDGPRPQQAVLEAIAAVNAMAAMGVWPGPRDPVHEAAVLQVRRRWARIQHRAKQAQVRDLAELADEPGLETAIKAAATQKARPENAQMRARPSAPTRPRTTQRARTKPKTRR